MCQNGFQYYDANNCASGLRIPVGMITSVQGVYHNGNQFVVVVGDWSFVSSYMIVSREKCADDTVPSKHRHAVLFPEANADLDQLIVVEKTKHAIRRIGGRSSCHISLPGNCEATGAYCMSDATRARTDVQTRSIEFVQKHTLYAANIHCPSVELSPDMWIHFNNFHQREFLFDYVFLSSVVACNCDVLPNWDMSRANEDYRCVAVVGLSDAITGVATLSCYSMKGWRALNEEAGREYKRGVLEEIGADAFGQ